MILFNKQLPKISHVHVGVGVGVLFKLEPHYTYTYTYTWTSFLLFSSEDYVHLT